MIRDPWGVGDRIFAVFRRCGARVYAGWVKARDGYTVSTATGSQQPLPRAVGAHSASDPPIPHGAAIPISADAGGPLDTAIRRTVTVDLRLLPSYRISAPGDMILARPETGKGTIISIARRFSGGVSIGKTVKVSGLHCTGSSRRVEDVAGVAGPTGMMSNGKDGVRTIREPRRLAEESLATAQHRWTEGDDLVAFYLSRHGTHRLPLRQAGMAERLGMSEAFFGSASG